MSIVAEHGKLYPSAHLFTLMNRYLYGEEVSAASFFPSICAWAVRSSPGHSLLLSNLTDTPAEAVLKFGGCKAGKLQEYQISSGDIALQAG